MRYLGGKARIAGEVAGYLNAIRNCRPYWEPFVGAGWILARIQGMPNFASDANGALIAMWQALQNGWQPPEHVSEDEYQAARELHDTDPSKAFIGFGCSFGGKWFGGYARDNRGGNYAARARRSLLSKLETMPEVQFYRADFLTALPPTPGMLIYCDPPYRSTTGYGAVGDFDHDAFWQRCAALERCGHVVLISEYSAPEGFSVVWRGTSKMGLRNGDGKQEARAECLFRYGEHEPQQPLLFKTKLEGL